MDNRPLLRCLDATSRQFLPDMTFEEAVRIAITKGTRPTDPIDVVADGIYGGHVLTCEKSGSSYECWYGEPGGWTISYMTGATPAEAIERAQAACA